MPRFRNETLSNQKSLEDIMFPVKISESHARFGTDFCSQISRVVFNPTSQKIIAFHPATYRFVPNSEFIAPIIEKMEAGFGPENLDYVVQSFEDRQFFVSVNVKSVLYEVTKDDMVCPMVCFRNSYDGRVKQAISLAYYRQLCSNGLMGFAKHYTMEAKHSQGNELPASLDKILDDISAAGNRLSEFRRLADRRVLPDELNEMMEVVKKNKSLNFPVRNIGKVPSIAINEAKRLDVDLNAWLVYNAFNNVLNHSDTRLFPHEKERIDKNVLSYVGSFSN